MFRLLALTLLTLPFTLADSDQYCPDSDYALEPEDAYDLAYNFGKLVSNYNSDLADNTLDPSFVDFSEGVNSMIDNGGDSPVSLLGPTFSSRTGFKDASSKQPSVPFRLKQVWVSCDWVTFRWESDQSPKPVVGISVGHAVPAPFGNLTPFRYVCDFE
ncbi:hypothetical protein K470DRAFT_260710 [Piedraia hortae CBS 480.64]|uniref:NTF2-like domain-containing protein n=1 Tax=Piedraia hortae CBS 480.64 TaxID=1314780 RepID=A0A6A7BS09_9PEZI|nr:hypothetical protein K470DRAFT_260710 [Piedraia hortae CBS 480.64]